MVIAKLEQPTRLVGDSRSRAAKKGLIGCPHDCARVVDTSTQHPSAPSNVQHPTRSDCQPGVHHTARPIQRPFQRERTRQRTIQIHEREFGSGRSNDCSIDVHHITRRRHCPWIPVGAVEPIAIAGRARPGNHIGRVHGERGRGAEDGAKGVGHAHAELRAAVGQRQHGRGVGGAGRAWNIHAVALPLVSERRRTGGNHAEAGARSDRHTTILRRRENRDRPGHDSRGESVWDGGVVRAIANWVAIDADEIRSSAGGIVGDVFRQAGVAI